MLRTALRALLRVRGLGYLKSKDDPRDHIMAARRLALPDEAMDLDSWVTLERNQGAIGACTSHAIDHAIQAVCGSDEGPGGGDYSLRSVAYPYYLGRALAGIEHEDGGAYLRDVFKAWAQMGSPPDAVSPLRITTVNKQPKPDAYRQGRPWRRLKYKRIPGNGSALVNGIHGALADKKPIVIGILVDGAFMDGDGPDVVPAQKGSDIVGGHAIMLSGYVDGGDKTRLVNSWGRGWRDGGRAWVSRGFLAQCQEAWTVEGWT